MSEIAIRGGTIVDGTGAASQRNARGLRRVAEQASHRSERGFSA